MHYYQFNIGNYRRQTHHLSLLEHGVYRSLLDTYYLSEEPLCADITKLMRSHCIRTADEQKALENVLNDFFLLSDGYYTHSTCEEVIAKYQTKSEKARNSAKARWGQKNDANAYEEYANALQSDSEGNADGMLEGVGELCQDDANHKPITINHKPITKDQETMPTDVGSDQVIEQTDQGDQSAKPDNSAIDIFHYWCDSMRKNRMTSKMTPKRMKAIKDRLKQGYTVDDIKLAIYNCSQDPWSMGNNDRQKPFNDIELICRSGEKLESYLDAVQQKAAARNVNSIGTDFSPPKGWNI